jgi:hypothetical protein
VVEFLVALSVKTIPHPPYLTDLYPTDLYLFSRVKTKLASMMLTHDSFKRNWGGWQDHRKEDFAATFRWWMEHCEKCVQVGGNYVKKEQGRYFFKS